MKVPIPDRHPVKLVDFPRLDGGLNLWELDYRLDSNQSSEMKNMWWQDGVLQCRDGQTYVYQPSENIGKGYASYSELFWDNAFFHIGSKLYYLNPEAEAPVLTELYVGVPEIRGTFFRYNDWLFYKTKGAFIKIKYNADGGPKFSASSLTDEAYTPVIVINARPGDGGGDAYQPENRLSAKKTVWYNAADGVKDYKLPVSDIDSIVEVKVDGAATTAYTADLAAGKVTFDTAPPVTSPATNNTVSITFTKANEDAYNSVMDCRYAVVYGGDRSICIVLGGCEKQPNAFFWSGNDDLSMNAGYFPMSFYNLAGDTEDSITGFGKQYGELLVFKTRSIGKASYNVVDVDGRDSISLTYTNINSKIGCDLPWTIQLVENNLTFCNTDGGVHIVRDSTAAYENNIECLSRNVNGTEQRFGLLEDIRAVDPDTVCSFDDSNRYWVIANGHSYLWDYLLSGWNKPSWFYFTNIHATDFFHTVDKTYHLDAAGRVTAFVRSFMDYGGAIEKVYQFPPQYFGAYDRLKDVLYCLFTVRSDTDSVIKIQYQSDYETRYDLTDITTYSWRMAPRNLAYRCLSIRKFAHVAKRSPGCGRVRHFSMRLSNYEPAQDLAILSAQIYFRYLGRDR